MDSSEKPRGPRTTVKRVAIGVSIAVNAVVIAAVIWIATGSAMNTIMRIGTRFSHERWVSQFALLDVSDGDTVFLGDSITEGGNWHELVPGCAVKNRGIGGDTTEGVLARLDHVTSGRPARVFLMIGTNDLFAGVAEDEIVANVAEIVRRIGTESPGTEVFVQSVLPRAARYRSAVESLNASLERSVAGTARWVDLYPLFLDRSDGSIKDTLSNDELHLLGDGYLLWRDAIADLLR
ncbi:MAG: GDSL-type esterase/lipase family protein [Spirochaetota bacterium]